MLAIVGATGTGKSQLALDVADALAQRGRTAEVVNADAMQLYRGMDVGTAKLPFGERRGVPHHLMDELRVTDEASVAWYQPRARAAVSAIEARGAVPILVGGSGLYASSVLGPLDFPGTDEVLRQALEADLERDGTAAMHARLAAVDARAAAAIGPHNGRRLVRALEVVTSTGEPFPVGLPDVTPGTTIVHVRRERAALVAALDARVERMWAQGMLDEVRALVDEGLERGTTAQAAIGYRQALDQLHGRIDEAEAIARTQHLTRRYARRQVSWFQRYPALDVEGPVGADRIAESLATT
ncbi:tRNA (adenosine(37)-N6)-dimethylallyltransferase MiaA [Agrococcus sp. SGAir0287]|uniref:tRNA (adenosine(37)-N6)-dimethylallyltransferase MiaA n=1 Tax=Agrococcus sp. SGAir0287 TaxID=2070347 RepID=UPI0010CCB76C|nr:tRNA (adenosine(37)-N6)-dimethylallyltransferase MiaA [Agrococcus sp. SGAir0287]QCR19613.1 tRNA (adenosine(37)-N6)-dimethylallyltransferase MiaA [Agrococcus sp. SGAir0287]